MSRGHLLFAVLLLFSGPVLTAADKKEPANLAWMEAGKADAKAAFAKQAAAAPKPTTYPHFVGEYLWSGRADDNYKPFFMFELRLRGATRPLTSARYRVVTLDPLRKPQTSGPWVDLGQLVPGVTRDLSYKLNAPTFQAFQVELAWKDGGKDGQEISIAWDKVAMVPVALSDVATLPFLISLNQNYEHDANLKIATVSFHLWNIGGRPAKEVVQTLQFKDDKGKTVHSHEFKPLKGDIAAGFVGEVKLSVPKVPAFSYLAIATRMTDLGSLDPGSFTGAEDIEIAQVRSEGKVIKAKIRNGFKTPVSGVVALMTLTDAGGKALKSLSLPVGDLKPGEERDVSADISTVSGWSGYEVGWKSSEPPVKAKVESPSTAQSLTVDGLEFTVTSTKAAKEGLLVSGVLRNKRDADLDGLVVSFTLPDGSKEGSVVTLKPGKLSTGNGVDVNFTAVGVKSFTGMALKWVSLKPQ